MSSRSESSSLERTFAFYWRALADGLPEPEREYRFASPRRWRFDFAWPAQRVAVECDGGTYSGGRHTRGDGYRREFLACPVCGGALCDEYEKGMRKRGREDRHRVD